MSVDPFLDPERLVRLQAAGFRKIRVIPGAGCALVSHVLEIEGTPQGFGFLLRLNRPEWGGKTTDELYGLVEGVILEGIQQRRTALGGG